MKALGHMVSDKKIFFFSIVSLRELLSPRGGTISDPRGMLGRIHVKLHIAMLHTKYRSFGCLGFREEDFFMYFPLADNDAARARPVWTPRATISRINL